MNKIKYAESSQEYSRLVTGCMRWGLWGAKHSVSAYQELIEESINLGMTTFDHADIYGEYTTEQEFGEAIKDMQLDRKDYQLITKCGIRKISEQRPANIINSYDQSKAYIIESVERSLKNLESEYIDLLLIHRPSPLMRPAEIVEAVTELKSSGKILDFGVSNFTISQFDLLNSYIPIVTNQLEISLVSLDVFMDGILDYLQSKKIKPQAWSPLGGTQLFSSNSRSEDSERVMRLQTVCKKYDWNLAEMALLFLLHHPANISPVLGTSKVAHLKSASWALEKSITDEQWFEIWTASKGESVP